MNVRSAARRPVGSWEEPFRIRGDSETLEDPDPWITVIANLGWLRKITLFWCALTFPGWGTGQRNPFCCLFEKKKIREEDEV